MATHVCATCGSFFERKDHGKYCTPGCYRARGPDGPRKTTVNGPRGVTLPSHPLATPSGRLLVSRRVLYDAIGPGPHPCHWCGTELRWMVQKSAGVKGNLLVDHLDWDRFNDEPANLVPSCNSCNARRAAPGKRGAIGDNEATIPVGRYRTRAVERTCVWCGETFPTRPSRPGKYCPRCWADRPESRRSQGGDESVQRTAVPVHGALRELDVLDIALPTQEEQAAAAADGDGGVVEARLDGGGDRLHGVCAR